MRSIKNCQNVDAPDLMKVSSLEETFGMLEKARTLEQIDEIGLQINDHLETELASRKKLKLDKETIDGLTLNKKSELLEVNQKQDELLCLVSEAEDKMRRGYETITGKKVLSKDEQINLKGFPLSLQVLFQKFCDFNDSHPGKIGIHIDGENSELGSNFRVR